MNIAKANLRAVILLSIVASIGLSVAGTAAAQDRMPPIPDDKMTDAQKKVAAELIAGPRGKLVGPFIPLLRSPDLMSRVQKVGEYIRYENSLGHKLTEFTILMTSRRWTQEVEWDSHYDLALKAGLEPEILAAVREGRRPTGMSADEEMVYDFCSELNQNQSVSDATYERAVKGLGEQGVIDLTATVGYYTMLAMILNVARTPSPAGKTPALADFPH
jgi:4-carboxymuconolactone decarboxylase